MTSGDASRRLIAQGRAVLGIELGSTRIKACLIGDHPADVLAVGEHTWESSQVEGHWTYSLDEVWHGVQSAYADLAGAVRAHHDVQLTEVRAMGVSAMMHGYLALDADDQLLVPMRTWRNTSTGRAAGALTELFGQNIPLRWSIAHLHQAVLDREPHVPQVAFLTTLAGYVHWQLTGRKVLGVGDASGMFPVDTGTTDYDEELLRHYDELVAGEGLRQGLRDLLPEVLPAGATAGVLTARGAALLDPTGTLQAGAVLAPPEGDAGTGMVATNAVAPGTGNVSAGTSIFAMVVLGQPLRGIHHEIDLVTTPAGHPVAMVHCNNGASELASWAGLFGRFAEAAGTPMSPDDVFEVLLREALEGEADGGGLAAYNYLAGEPITGLEAGVPLFLRTPGSSFTLANTFRAQLYAVFGTLALGLRILSEEGVGVERMFAHGGLFRTAGVAQRFLAAALDAPVVLSRTASEGGAWGMAVLAAYLQHAETVDLTSYLQDLVFADAPVEVTQPHPEDVTGFAAYLDTYRAGLAAERAAVQALSPQPSRTTTKDGP